ncbi:MAG: ABC transporter ATP-binding protein [Cyclobacteriaceae bacterium]|nr:ABC transporter ATP-binding protein [Cyclobacteriaceae bacterium]
MADPIISVRNVRKYFRDTRAIDGVDLEIDKGEYLALLGPNGAGKTTLVEMIEGIQAPDSGEIFIKGKPWKGHEERLHHVIGLSLQETHFIEKLTVRETLKLFAGFYGLKRARVAEILDLTRLGEKENTWVKNLSGGQRQKLALGIALINRPEILLLDEPTTGLDPGARREIWEILKNLQTEFQTTMLLTTHYMEEASYLCEKIVIIDSGKVLAKGTLDQLLIESKCNEIISLSTHQPMELSQLTKITDLAQIELSNDGCAVRILVNDLITVLPAVLKYIDAQKITPRTLECRKMTLDDLFIRLTGRHLTEQ